MKQIFVFFLVFLPLSCCGPIPIPKFDCPKLPNPPPAENVRSLHPHDIKVVMAMGDSISAGFAMHSGHAWDIFDLVEYRGDVFSIGGNKDQLTIPNFLKNYNPSLVGASIGTSLPLDAIKWQHHIIEPWDAKVTHLNAAQSMAKIAALPGQVDYLTEQLKTTYNQTVNFEKDWKMLTILIGANNLCICCHPGRQDATPEYFEQQLNMILEKVHQQIPRVFVNVLTLFNISQVYTFSQSSDYCIFMWDTFCKGECPCMTDNSTPDQRRIMDEHSVAFNQRMYKVAKEWQAKNLPDFNVKVQPFLENLIIPKEIGLDFLSELDCFHPSYLADAGFAIGLWNNMLTPDSEKAHSLSPQNITIKCPDSSTVLQQSRK